MPKGGFPEGKFMATVTVGEKGQIVIPKAAREMFGIAPGEILLLLADIDQGIALVKNDVFTTFAEEVFRAQPKPQQNQEEEEGSE